jgi:hypothetical protein
LGWLFLCCSSQKEKAYGGNKHCCLSLSLVHYYIFTMHRRIVLLLLLVVSCSCNSHAMKAAALVQLRLKPLIGGPSWLPLHVACVVEHTHVWDFIPKEATSKQTLQSLVSLQSVPGEIRYVSEQDYSSSSSSLTSTCKVHQAHTFVDSYTNCNLHLVTNNCWTFALMLYWHLLTEDIP